MTETADKRNSLLEASRDGELNRVRELLDLGAFVDSLDVLSGYTPLHYAIGSGNVEIVELLLDSGADIEHSKNTVLTTPLSYAVFSRRIEMVRVLLARGANPNACVYPDSKPLIEVAREESSSEILALLVAHSRPT